MADLPMVGTSTLKYLEKELASRPVASQQPLGKQELAKLVELHFELGRQRLNQAQFDQVVPELDTALQLAREAEAPERLQALMLFNRAVAKMRIGETANCTGLHNPYICLLFVGPDGAFEDKSQTESAIKDFEGLLQEFPDHVPSRWLLNVAHMLTGTYPDGVPAQWQIPAARFESQHEAPRFTDIGHDLEVAAVNLAGGSIMDDFDNDGNLDILTTTYQPCEHVIYYHNDGNGRMSDRSLAAGLGEQLGGFNGMQADYDNDGWLDLFITRGAWLFDYGRKRNSLLHNNGDGSFTDVTFEAGLARPSYPTLAAAWSDYDNDGNVDIYVGNEANNQQQPYPSQLFHNNGDGTFTDVAPAAGVTNDRMAKGVAWGDYDNDGDLDLYVSNFGPNRLYRNNGDGSFTDVAPLLKVTEPAGQSFVPWFWDYDNDGWLDLIVAGYGAAVEDIALDYLGQQPEAGQRPRLYRNTSRGAFEDVTGKVGLNRVMLPMGANFGDIDNDGWPDFYLGTGDPQFSTLVPNVMFWNDSGQRFVDVTESARVGHLPKGHGIAFGDVDNDGDQDIYLQAGGFFPGDAHPNALFENPGAGNHWLTAKLVGERSNRAAIGARIAVTVTEGARQRPIHVEVTSGGSFGANSLQQEIGLGQAERIDALEIYWPASRIRQVFRDLAVDQFLEIHEGDTEVRVVDRPRIPLYHEPGIR
jgi:hypothetical protein